MVLNRFNKISLIAALILIVLLTALLLKQQTNSAQNTFQSKTIPYQDAVAVANGQAIYQQQCAACHGADLSGQANWQKRNAQGYLPAPPHNQTGHTWHHADLQLFTMVKGGVQAIVGTDYRTNMMAFDTILTDEEIWAVLAYIKSTWPQEIITAHNRFNEN